MIPLRVARVGSETDVACETLYGAFGMLSISQASEFVFFFTKSVSSFQMRTDTEVVRLHLAS